MIASLVLAAFLIAISAIDLRTLRIPDVLSLPLIASGLGLAAIDPRTAFGNHLLGAGGGFLLLALIGEAYFSRRGTEGLGLGDAKLFGAAGAWLGWQALPMVLLIASVGGLAQALVQRGGRHGPEIAFGPWLALGFWTVWSVSRS